jgi:VanZ family protein
LIQPSSIPDVEFEFFIPFDKIVHFLMYLGFSGATALYYVYDKKGLSINMPLMFIGAIIVPILYGGLIEIIQDRYFPPRSGDWFDFLADILGTLTAIPIILYFRAFLVKRQMT